MIEIPLVDIAIAGKLGSAKTYCSNLLVEKHGYTRLSFATPLKRMLQYVREEKWVDLAKTIYDDGPALKDVISDPCSVGHYEASTNAVKEIVRWWKLHGEDEEFVNGKGREFMQYFGTDYFRRQDPDYWVKWFVSTKPQSITGRYFPADCPQKVKRFVVDDIRFPDELACVKKLGFLTLRCDVSDERRAMRVSQEDLSHMNHSSELMLDGLDDEFDGVIDTGCHIDDQYEVLVTAIQDAYNRRIGGR